MTFQLLPTHLLVGTLNLFFPLTCSKGIFLWLKNKYIIDSSKAGNFHYYMALYWWPDMITILYNCISLCSFKVVYKYIILINIYLCNLIIILHYYKTNLIRLALFALLVILNQRGSLNWSELYRVTKFITSRTYTIKILCIPVFSSFICSCFMSHSIIFHLPEMYWVFTIYNPMSVEIQTYDSYFWKW